MARYLGQHFLKNKAKIKKIIEALELRDNDTVIEIGPGHGELTGELLAFSFQLLENGKNPIKIIAIEKDARLVLLLKEKFKDDKNIEIITGDVLKILPELTKSYKLKAKSYKLVGNIPYYITGYLFRILGELENKPSLIILLIQKEVAERACALRQAQGKPKMNLLAASVQFWAELKMSGYVSKKDFRPQPKVDSAIVKLTTHNLQPTTEETEKYYTLIKILFKQPRKTIVNNLRPTTNNLQLLREQLESIGISLQARPQDLSVAEIIQLSQILNP